MSDDAGIQRVTPDSSLVRSVRVAVEDLLSSVDDDPVVAVYLYGSASRGRVTGLSDLDLAVLFREGVSEDRRWRELPRLGSAVARSLSRGGKEAPDVDVHDLASMPIAVQGRVLTEGVLILSTDEVGRVRFEERTRRGYFDFLPFQERDTEERLEGLHERDSYLVDDEAVAASKYLLITAIEDVLSVANHIIASEGWRSPADYADDARVHRFLQADLGDFDEFTSAVLDLLEEDV